MERTKKTMMNKREVALAIIRRVWAESGMDTVESIRAYIENRVSKQARDKAAAEGLRIYKRMQQYND